MEIIAFLVVGLIAGWLASLLMKTNTSQGFPMDIILGVVGAFIGGFIMNMLGESGVTGFNIYSIAVATLGAVVLIALGRTITRA